MCSDARLLELSEKLRKLSELEQATKCDGFIPEIRIYQQGDYFYKEQEGKREYLGKEVPSELVTEQLRIWENNQNYRLYLKTRFKLCGILDQLDLLLRGLDSNI